MTITRFAIKFFMSLLLVCNFLGVQMLIEGVKKPGEELTWIFLLPNFKLLVTCKGNCLEQLMWTHMAFKVFWIPYLLNEFSKPNNEHVFQVNIVEVVLSYSVEEAIVPQRLNSTKSLYTDIDIVCKLQIV